ncbi:hypothetical protein [Kribbella sp. NPDC048915]|uniref:hypothetical protein n=1 Tax=Kribbella sp. NPDC048915 TaxID=3155148 RepID=UPI0033D8247B
MGAVVLVLAAIAVTGLSVAWLVNRADAIQPVALPTAGKSIETVSPSVKPSETPVPNGRVVGTQMMAGNSDTMPVMSSAWGNAVERTGLTGGAAVFLVVHPNYNGKKSNWGNYVSFGQLPVEIPFSTTPAGMKQAAIQIGARAIANLYDKDAVILKGTKHTPITVAGHRGHEIVARVQVKEPMLKETFSTVMIAVIDRGNGTAAVSIADIAGSTPAWQNVWRFKVSQIKINP